MSRAAGPVVCSPAVGIAATSAVRRPSALVFQRNFLSSRSLLCRADGEEQQPSTSQKV
jgi:hypothetical protein